MESSEEKNERYNNRLHHLAKEILLMELQKVPEIEALRPDTEKQSYLLAYKMMQEGEKFEIVHLQEKGAR